MTDQRPSEYIFVYGTLMRGFHNNRLLNDADFIERATLTGNYEMKSMGGFPGVWVDDTMTREHVIQGEIWKVYRQSTMNMIDRLEGHPDWYRRVKKTVENAEGYQAEAWVYLQQSPKRDDVGHHTTIASGCWREFSKKPAPESYLGRVAAK